MKLYPRSYWMTPQVSKAVLTEWQQQNMYSRLHLLTSLCFRWPHQSQLRGQIMHTRLVLLFDRSSVPRVGASIAIKTTQLLGALLVLLLLPACWLACWLPSQCSIVSFVPPCRSVHVLEYTTCENTLGEKLLSNVLSWYSDIGSYWNHRNFHILNVLNWIGDLIWIWNKLVNQMFVNCYVNATSLHTWIFNQFNEIE